MRKEKIESSLQIPFSVASRGPSLLVARKKACGKIGVFLQAEEDSPRAIFFFIEAGANHSISQVLYSPHGQ
ncbi:hypothetical protein GCM10010954_24620 [Halobacillus andaensis]|uniref:Uncharacterized protein n=1 Tax=Halobacillus andaensis TaxID=1176239 RepID=A0A917EYY9_HALAA|nr:glucose/arabinose dehydrogenase [Halobacillus andaensis]GGF24786.1 hypothetical protein GCM10010954_24620 [Halobacillus andaensis]